MNLRPSMSDDVGGVTPMGSNWGNSGMPEEGIQVRASSLVLYLTLSSLGCPLSFGPGS